MGKELEIKFVKNMRYAARGICLYWIDEIHIDEEFKNHPALNDIVAHEKYHYKIISNALSSKPLKRYALGCWNNIWDFFSSFKISIKYCRYFPMEFIWNILFIMISILIFWRVLSG